MVCSKRSIHLYYSSSLYDGSLSRAFSVLQGTGQGRIITPFVYKVLHKRLVLLGRLMTEPKIAPAVITLFDSRFNSYFNPDINSMGFFVHINESLCKYNLNTYFED